MDLPQAATGLHQTQVSTELHQLRRTVQWGPCAGTASSQLVLGAFASPGGWPAVLGAARRGMAPRLGNREQSALELPPDRGSDHLRIVRPARASLAHSVE